MGSDLVNASSLCWTFAQNGSCPRGDHCRWTHERLPIRPDTSDTTCRAWLLWGTCPRAEQCTWHHPPVCMRAAPPWALNGNGEACVQLCGSVYYPPDHNLAMAGRQLMSMMGVSEDGTLYGSGAAAQDHVPCPLQPWLVQDSSCFAEQPVDESITPSISNPTDLDVVLESMSDVLGKWDQFEVNEKNFGVKTSFRDDLSQYTTQLQLDKISTEVKQEAERIASEIEHEHKASLGASSGELLGEDSSNVSTIGLEEDEAKESPDNESASIPDSPAHSHDDMMQYESGENELIDTCVTTLMICDIPCRQTMEQLVEVIKELGFGVAYNLVYMPSYKRRKRPQNFGYAFVNFNDPGDAAAFATVFEGFRFPGSWSKKSSFTKAALTQGFEENLVMHKKRLSTSDLLLLSF